MKSKGDRELINTGTDKRYVRRDEQGRFEESDDVGRSLSQDVKRHAGTGVPSRSVRRGVKSRGDVVNSVRDARSRPKAGERRLSEDEIERQLEAQGAITLPAKPRTVAPRPAPIEVPGRPLSETIMEERR